MKPSPAQEVTWKRLDGLAVVPSVPVIVELTLAGSQEVGFRVNSFAVEGHPDLAQVERDAVEDRRQRIGDRR